jgi:hypothetical protein
LDSRVRIFQIGFNKCATSSLHNFFQRNGLASVHWEEGRLAARVATRLKKGEDPFLDYPDTIAFTDMIMLSATLVLEPYKAFAEIYRWYPQSYFVLNTRHCRDWIESRVKHGFVPRYQVLYKLPDEAAVRRLWMQDWYTHHAKVLKFFADKPQRLLVYDIDRDAPQQLARFLEAHWQVDPALLGRDNQTPAVGRPGTVG